MGIKIKLAYLLTVLALTACGGGDDEKPPTQLSGGATKGLIKNGKVDLYVVTAAGDIASSVLASTFTNDKGMFSFSLVDVPVMSYVEVSGRDDDISLMQCDLSHCGAALDGSEDTNKDGVITFGEWQAIGPDFKLTAYLSGWASQQALSVNLYTHLVAQHIADDVSADNLDAAYSDLQQTLGLRQLPHEVMPVDVNEAVEDEAIVDNLMMAGMLEMVDSEDEPSSIEERISKLAGDSADTVDSILPENMLVSDIGLQAIQLSRSLEGEAAEAVNQNLRTLTNASAEQENTLKIADRPLLPPLL